MEHQLPKVHFHLLSYLTCVLCSQCLECASCPLKRYLTYWLGQSTSWHIVRHIAIDMLQILAQGGCVFGQDERNIPCAFV